MKRHSHTSGYLALAVAPFLLIGPAGPTMAQTVLSGDHQITGNLTVDEGLFVDKHSVIDGSLCLGNTCTPTEVFNNDVTLRMRFTQNTIEVIDTSGSINPSNDWVLRFNDNASFASGGINKFAVEDTTAGTTPFTLAAGAPSNTLWLDSSGMVGIGTMLPSQPLQVSHASQATLRLDYTGSGGPSPRIWDIKNQGTLEFIDATSGNRALRIYAGAEDDMLALTNTGGVGIGTHTTKGRLTIDASPVPYGLVVEQGNFSGIPAEAFAHFRGDQGTTQLKIEETTGTQTARPLLNMVNHGRPDIIMANTATGGEWAFGAGTNFVLKNGAVGSGDGDKNLQLKLYGATGNLEIAGQIITGGPTCTGGCDAVFSEDYDLPSISEHAAEMFALGHLPNVGPTAPNQPVNMSEQYGKLLNELEHAHIYIARQDDRIARLETLVETLLAE